MTEPRLPGMLPPSSAEGQAAPFLDDARPPPRRVNLFVICLGVASTVITLVLVEMMRDADFDPMLLFVNFVIPVGAILVGLVAGLGYALGIWLRQARLNRRDLTLMAGLHMIAWALLYAAAWWKSPMGPQGVHPIGLITWFDVMTRSLGWMDDHGHPGTSFGGLGYVVRLGELGGFILGGLITPGALMIKPYCEPCQRYLNRKSLFHLPAAAPVRNFVRQKTINAANLPVMAQLEADRDLLAAAIASGAGPQVTRAVESIAPRTKLKGRVKRRFRVLRHRCPGCGVGLVDFTMQDTRGRSYKRVARFPVDANLMTVIEAAAADLPEMRRRAEREQSLDKTAGSA